jgi:hypothetical protein
MEIVMKCIVSILLLSAVVFCMSGCKHPAAKSTYLTTLGAGFGLDQDSLLISSSIGLELSEDLPQPAYLAVQFDTPKGKERIVHRVSYDE